MFNDLQTSNVSALFRIFDANQDGHLEWSDYDAIITTFSEQLGLSRSSDGYRMLRGAFERDWAHLRESADADRDGVVSLDEFVVYHDHMLATEIGYRIAVEAVAELMIGLADRDHDGALTLEDYGLLLRAFRIETSGAGEAFARIDRDGDGRITTAELLLAVQEFFRSGDPGDPGHWLFGGPHHVA